RIGVIFFDTENVPLEKYNFKLQLNQCYRSLLEEADLEFSLRSFPNDMNIYVSLCIPTDTNQWHQTSLITPSS
ncbi:DNA polymerase zeta processivity subunit, partial [Bienertia sinuspersici]